MNRKVMKEKFLSEYTLIDMKRNSLRVRNNKSGKDCYIHRNAFNSLNDAVDYREVTDLTMTCASTWIEVLAWKRL